MTPKKKVILFIVEGFNDQTALALPLEKLLTNEHVKFDVVNGDITSDFTGKNISAKLGDYVNMHSKVYDTYCDSWDYIKKNTNSLKKCSNFNVFLSLEAIRTPRDFTDLLA